MIKCYLGWQFLGGLEDVLELFDQLAHLLLTNCYDVLLSTQHSQTITLSYPLGFSYTSQGLKTN